MDEGFTVVEHLAELFTGNQNGYGKHVFSDDGERKSWSLEGTVSKSDYRKHIEGKEGLGISPITGDSRCRFGCIDVDAHHGSKGEVDIKGIERKVRTASLPLMVCRSSSGGGHLYAFFGYPIRASECKRLLSKWVTLLGLDPETTEVFPKQTYIDEKGMGNTINIPYFNSDVTNRYGIYKGEKLPLEVFLNRCDYMMIDEAQVENMTGEDHSDAPPCVQLIIEGDKTIASNRNEALYNITLYLKKKNPDTYREDVADLNKNIFKKALGLKELRQVVASASKKDYKYRCGEEPCRSLCNKEACVERKYGITDEEAQDLKKLSFDRLVKHMTEPVQWRLYLGEICVQLTTSALLDYRRLTEAVAEKATVLLPSITPAEWRRTIQLLMENAEVEAAPEDATSEGLLLGKLREFLRRARIPEGFEDVPVSVRRESLLRGVPVAEYHPEGFTIAHFRGQDFLDYLRKQRYGDIRSSVIWMQLKDQGVISGRLKVLKQSVLVWTIVVELDDNKQVIPKFAMDF